VGLGDNQPCPSCGQSVGKLPISSGGVSTALDDLSAGEKPVVFGAYSEAAVASWDDPTEPAADQQVANLIANEALIDNAIINDMPPEVRAKYEARQREARKKILGLAIAVLVIVGGVIAVVFS
tara:strand:- start:858 stop:1226 length:369 start_codon:yes stop_codon:yes gene_type:complete